MDRLFGGVQHTATHNQAPSMLLSTGRQLRNKNIGD